MQTNDEISNFFDVNIIKVFDKFYETTDDKVAIHTTLKEMCDLLSFDKISVIIEDNIFNSYIKCFDYKLGKTPNSYMEKSNCNLPEISKLKNDDNIDKTNFLELFGNSNYFYNDNYLQVNDTFKNLNYEKEKPNSGDIHAFLIDANGIFSFIVFENDDAKSELNKSDFLYFKTAIRIIFERFKNLKMSEKMFDANNIKTFIIENEKMPVALIEKDTFTILYFNELFKQILPNVKLGGTCYELKANSGVCKDCCVYSDQLIPNLESNNRHWIRKSVPITLQTGTEAFIVYAKDTFDYIEQLEGIDFLTQSLSLKGFENNYEKTIKKNDSNFALCALDVDKFRHINNSFGHDIGDLILRQIADVLNNFLQDDEFFCRITEDRFAIMVKYDSADRLTYRFYNLKKDFELMQQTSFENRKLTIIGGITFVDREVPLNLLIDQANFARKNTKGSHETRFSYYDESLDKEAAKEKMIEERMFFAVRNEEFVPYLQPKFDIKTKKICGAEALVRWITPDCMIYPDEFIPMFEKNGFINILDFIVYKKVMQYIRMCLDNNKKVYPISINVSRGHIQDKFFLTKILELFDSYQIPLELVELEVTESVFIEDKDSLKNFIDTLREKNLKVSIDDFGTAYSSLHILKDIDVDILKIDKEFLTNVNTSPDSKKPSKDEIVIKHIINMAKDLDFEVICEGVETEEQIELLRNIDCQYGQGYVFARPMPLDEYDKKFA